MSGRSCWRLGAYTIHAPAYCWLCLDGGWDRVRALVVNHTHTSRASPSRFFPHHVAAISAAVTQADATVILNAASTMSFKLSVGLPALS